MIRPAHKSKQNRDDSLFGLLAAYKSYVTYVRILISEEEKKIAIQITDNPKNWEKSDKERYKNFRMLSRLEMGASKLSIKYIKPQHLIKILGPALGLNLPPNKVHIINDMETTGLLVMETSLKYRNKIMAGINKLIKASPQKKYEILEKSLVENKV